MRDVAVVGFAQRQMQEFDGSPTCVELLVPLFAECYEQTGWSRRDIGFWCSGSSDYLAGRSFSFVQAVDAIGVIQNPLIGYSIVWSPHATLSNTMRIHFQAIRMCNVKRYGGMKSGNKAIVKTLLG